MVEEEIDVIRFIGLIGVLRFLEKNNSELNLTEKSYMGTGPLRFMIQKLGEFLSPFKKT